jgi:DNA-binding response OmpR family regulator
VPSEKTKILLVEDDPEDVLLVRQALETRGGGPACEIETASTVAAALAVLQRPDVEPYQAVLLDLSLPDSRGIGTFLMVRSARPDVPIVVLTGMTDQELALEAVRLGAQDYLVKGELEPRVLRRSVAYAIERGTLVANLEQLIDKAADGMVVVDSRRVVRFVNKAAEALMGREAEELLGLEFPLPFDPGRPAEVALHQRVGGDRTVELRYAPIEWKKERAWLATMRDLTELKRLERLRAEVRERKRIDELKERALSAVARELKDPLSIILAAIDNIEDGLAGPVTPEQREILETARRQVARAAKTVDDWLDARLLEARAAGDLNRH